MAYNKYVKGEKEIMATERAFQVVYKDQGYLPAAEVEAAAEEVTEAEEPADEAEGSEEETSEEDIREALNEMKVEELVEMAKAENMTGYSSMKKAELIEALI